MNHNMAGIQATAAARLEKLRFDQHVQIAKSFIASIGVQLPDRTANLDPVFRLVLGNIQHAFILGHYLGSPLKKDGIPGKFTSAAIAYSQANGSPTGGPRISANFTFREFINKRQPPLASMSNPVFYSDRNLIILAQAIREYRGIAYSPISAFRDPVHNRAVGGARNSTHMHGDAIDIDHRLLKLTEAECRRLGAHGVGIVRSTGWAAHVDVRGYPALWYYNG